tara:strand:+ start:346 stop:483 length:138 start_codon:yes stop_codon:yes gene_type:complete
MNIVFYFMIFAVAAATLWLVPKAWKKYTEWALKEDEDEEPPRFIG